MLTLPIDERLTNSRRVLVAGMGGGYDVLCALPLFFVLEAMGVEAHLASFSSTPLINVKSATHYGDSLLEVTADVSHPSYFTEGWLARWFRERQRREVPIWCFGETAPRNYQKNYSCVVERLGIDTVVLVDGGIGSLLGGTEAALGAPLDDALSLGVVSRLEGPQKILVTTAFGAEPIEHGDCQHVLTKISELTHAKALLGVSTLLGGTDEGTRFIDASRYVLDHQGGKRPSVVIGALLAALQGTHTEEDDALTINRPQWSAPLMCLYWYFDLMTVAKKNLYLPRLMEAKSYSEAAQSARSLPARRSENKWETFPFKVGVGEG